MNQQTLHKYYILIVYSTKKKFYPCGKMYVLFGSLLSSLVPKVWPWGKILPSKGFNLAQEMVLKLYGVHTFNHLWQNTQWIVPNDTKTACPCQKHSNWMIINHILVYIWAFYMQNYIAFGPLLILFYLALHIKNFGNPWFEMFKGQQLPPMF